MFKSKIVKAILIILAVIIIALGAFAIWQYDNIAAFIDGVNLDEQQINQKVEQSHKEITDYIENNNMGTLRPMTEEETIAYNNGEITKEDATKIMTGQITLEQAKENKANADKEAEEAKKAEQQDKQDKPDNNTQQIKPEDKPDNKKENKPENKPEDKPDNKKENQPEQPKDYDTLINEKVAELYVIKANYYAEFNSYWASAKAEFLARPVEERTQANVAAVVRNRMSEGFAMEDRYDAQVDQVVKELTELLKEAGRDTSLATSVKNAYIAEKKAEKARIIAKYFG